MKKLISLCVALLLVVSLATAAFAASPADSGWHTDDENFTGWTAADDGSLTIVYNEGVGDRRVWQDIIEDPNNFTVTVKVDAENNSRPIVKVMGVIVELNAEGGNGNQFFVKYSDGPNWPTLDWMDATECKATVVISRTNGGNLEITVTGEGNATPKTASVAPAEPDNENVELSIFSSNHEKGGVATFTVEMPEEETPPTTETPAPSTPSGDNTDDTENPKTGDFALLGLAVLTMTTAGAGLVITKKKD